MTATELIKSINWIELTKQKSVLLQIINHIIRNDNGDENIKSLQGILNFINKIQDFAVTELGLTESEVYQKNEEHSMMEELFAKNGAEYVYSDLLIFNDFHRHHNMSRLFVDTVLKSDFHSGKIKLELANAIRKDLKLMSETFQRGENNEFVCDGDMSNDYQHIVLNYLLTRLKKGMNC